MKYLIVLIIVLNYSLYPFHPNDELQFNYDEMPEIRLYSTGNIILEYNLFEIKSMALINNSDEDIYVWSVPI